MARDHGARRRLSAEELESIRDLSRKLCAEADSKKCNELVERLRQMIQNFLAKTRPN